PALKAADIGVAMGRGGTDAARSAAGLVILDDNFATIVAAVEEGRTVYRNIRRSVRFLLASNLGEVLSMLFCMALGLAPSLVPIQILMVNLLTDGLPAVALGLEPPAEDVMRTPPRPRGESLFAHGLGREIALRGTALGAASCAVYAAALAMGAPLAAARSACFLTVVFCQLVHLFEDRGAPLAANPALAWAAALSGAAALAGVYLPAAHALLGTAPVTGRLALYTALAVCVPGAAVQIGRRLWGGAKV
ncbi:MAG TPA: cation-translocating P-type ATPase, partial [Candidatus Ruthenibacterium merdigallinarum]|nr:cation-translocating P-type ATPase [Candidatus Ruthenibacterium merdigallinarum]